MAERELRLLVVVLEESLEPEPVEFGRVGMKRLAGQCFIHTTSYVPGGQALLNKLLPADAVYRFGVIVPIRPVPGGLDQVSFDGPVLKRPRHLDRMADVSQAGGLEIQKAW